MRVNTTDNRGYESINDGCMLVLNCDKGLTIKSMVLFHHVPEQRARIKELAQHLMQWVETGSLVIEKPVDKIVRQLETDHGYVTSDPVTINEVLGLPLSKDAREWLEADKKMLDEIIRPRLKEMKNPVGVGLPKPGETYETFPEENGAPIGTKIVEVNPTEDWSIQPIIHEPKPDG